MLNRRTFLQGLSLPAVASVLPTVLAETKNIEIIKKIIPSSGEAIPVVGMGSSRTFDHLNEPAMHGQLLEVLEIFFKMGGSLIDSSPMYGSAEALLGKLLAQLKNKPKVFAASKVWTYGKEAGIKAVATTEQRMGTKQMDLMQVHNLRDWKIHLQTLHEMKQRGQIRYVGITTSSERQYEEFEQVMSTGKLDFIQLNYSLGERKAEQRLLPLAMDKGIAVIVNRPFQRGQLFGKVKGQNLPQFVTEFGCYSWAQYFLKYIVSHPAVTAVIPATTKTGHMIDNMLAQTGKLAAPDNRQEMETFFSKL